MVDPADPGETHPLLLTRELLSRARDGDREALDVLSARYLPRLTRWASGRLPASARSLLDTMDLAQETMLRVIAGLDRVEVRGPGGFQAYVRQAILNRIRDEIRWAGRRPGRHEVPESLADPAPSPLEHAIGTDVVARYEDALARLPEESQQLLHFRLELDLEFAEIAAMTGRASPDAARMAVKRALASLVEIMGDER